MTEWYFEALSRSVLVGLAMVIAGQSPAQESDRVLECAGIFGSDSSHARLVQAFGQQNVRKINVYLGEGETRPGSVIFPDDPKSIIEII